MRAHIGPLFPELGFYITALDVAEKVGDTELGIGDAIDDLADIALDLMQVVARWEQNGEEEGLWYFRLLYRQHWRWHLRWLQMYLHERAF